MVKWKVTTAFALTGLMIAGPAFAQATTGSPATGQETKGEQPKGSETKPDSAGQMPRAGTDTKSGGMKSSGDMKSSDMMKSSGDMKAGGHKGGMAMGGGEERVKAVQQALKDKGHDPGDVDGKMGPKTQAALRDFQKAQGMQATGRIDNKTMQSLGVEGGAKTSAAGEATTGASASPKTDASKTDTKK